MPRLLPAPKLAPKEKLFLIKPCCIIHIYSLRIVNVWDIRSIAQRFVDDCVLAVKLKKQVCPSHCYGISLENDLLLSDSRFNSMDFYRMFFGDFFFFLFFVFDIDTFFCLFVFFCQNFEGLNDESTVGLFLYFLLNSKLSLFTPPLFFFKCWLMFGSGLHKRKMFIFLWQLFCVLLCVSNHVPHICLPVRFQYYRRISS